MMSSLTVARPGGVPLECGLYCRLSKEDENSESESASIATQRDILTNYVKERGWIIKEIYVDDGYSGTNFNRPRFQDMIKDIEAGKINCVLTKDLSRLGRNYLDCGRYLEIFFPEHGVRYIAVNDGVDTLDRPAMDVTPFRNILNEMYAADISLKVKSALRSRFNQGKFTGTNAPYGYRKDPEDKNHLVIDPEPAEVVRAMFNRALSGDGIRRIRDWLNSQHVLCPAAYAAVRGDMEYERFFENNDERRYIWNNNSVRQILRNPTYAGDLVGYKRVAVSMKSKKRPSRLPEEWEVIPDTHEAIVPREVFNTVQQMMTSRRKEQNDGGFVNVFNGIIKCEDCGYAMRATSAHRRKRPDPIDCVQFMCNHNSANGKSACSAHLIEARDLYDVVLADIQRLAELAITDSLTEKKLLQLLSDYDAEKYTGQENKKKKLLKRLTELDKLFSMLYEDRVIGNISDRNYKMMVEKYQAEQCSLEQQIEELQVQLESNASREQRVKRFVSQIQQFQGIKELTPKITNALIDRITVGERHEDENGETVQDLRIYYKFIGSLEKLPVPATKRYRVLPPRTCPDCGQEFSPGSGSAKRCKACSAAHHKEVKAHYDKNRSRKRTPKCTA